MVNKSNRTKIVQARLTLEEYYQIQLRLKASTCLKLSDYIRLVLFNKPIRVKQRNQSFDDFMSEMILLRTELNAIGNNYNQSIKKLHSLREYSEIRAWLLLGEINHKLLLSKIADIKAKIDQLNDLWLQ